MSEVKKEPKKVDKGLCQLKKSRKLLYLKIKPKYDPPSSQEKERNASNCKDLIIK